MNYYAQGGQAYGLKALAQELPNYGRHGDDVVAHISSDEARMLKAMGGSGTINPDTGLPEYFVKKIFRPVQQAVAAVNPFNPGSSLSKTINTTPVVGDINKALNNVGTQIFQPLEKAIVQPASRGLASFDKAVGKTIPGGWGTVGQVALSAMGAPMPLQVAYGTARGSGVMRKGGNFNLQGAMVGGATAYAMSELGDYMRGAAPEAALLPESVPVTDYSAPLVDGVNVIPPPSGLPSLPAGVDAGYFDVPPTALSSAPAAGDFAGSLSDPTAGMAQAYTPPPPPAPAPSFLSRIGTKAGDAVGGTTKFIAEAPTTGVSTAAQTGQGALNLLGIGEGTAKAAAANAATTGIKALPMAAMALYGETTLADLDAQRDFLKQQQAAGNIAQAEYDAALAEINRQAGIASDAVNRSPFSTSPDRDVSIGETFYGRGGTEDTLYGRSSPNATLYAMGGSVDDESGMDEARGIMQGNLQKGLFGQGYAAGGQPRFLSGGGDGMSDDIPATINNNQPARLADGEFVIPADVVSHIGNGSSKAGAKQLYSMMNKVRKARTGNPKQGKQINPRKYMPA
jgi:hypothetical protein